MMYIYSSCILLLLGASTASQAQMQSRKNLNQSSAAKATYSTRLDFDSTLIDGAMKAPMGFYLQGRNKQSLSNMIQLRSNFKKELNQSRKAVTATVN